MRGPFPKVLSSGQLSRITADSMARQASWAGHPTGRSLPSLLLATQASGRRR